MSARTESTHYAEMLSAVFEVMILAGYSKPDIERTIAMGLRQLETRNASSSRLGTEFVAAGLVLDAWHKKRRYLTERAEPKAIALFGRAPSVEALIRSQHPDVHSRSLINRLRALRLIVRVAPGRYKPAANKAVVGDLDWIVRQHAARSCATLLRTIKSNVHNRYPARKLIERLAEIPNLPVDEAAKFKQFTHTQGSALLDTVNDWLEARRSRVDRRASRTARAGIHVFAYFEPQSRRRARRRR